MCFGGAGGEPWGLFWAFLMVQDGRESGGPAWGGVLCSCSEDALMQRLPLWQLTEVT